MEKRLEDITKYLPEGWREATKETGALLRAREIKTADELLELNMLYLTAAGSFGTTAALLHLATETTICKTAVYKRIKNSWAWLKWMTEKMCQQNGYTMEKPVWLDRPVITVDASEMGVKGSKQGDYRLHCAFDIFHFAYRTLEVTSIKEGEKLSRHVIQPEDIILADRMYGTIQGMEHVLTNGGDFVLRYRTKAFNLYDEQGNRIDLLKRFNALQPMESMSIAGWYYTNGIKRPVRIVAMRKDEKSIEASQRKLRDKLNSKQIRAMSQESKDFNKYIVLATSLTYSDERILELYRARWQVEQVFYRLKELFGFGEVPSTKDDSVRAWFYGKLFLAVLCEVILKKECFSPTEKKLLFPFTFSESVEMLEDHLPLCP